MVVFPSSYTWDNFITLLHASTKNGSIGQDYYILMWITSLRGRNFTLYMRTLSNPKAPARWQSVHWTRKRKNWAAGL